MRYQRIVLITRHGDSKNKKTLERRCARSSVLDRRDPSQLLAGLKGPTRVRQLAPGVTHGKLIVTVRNRPERRSLAM